MKKVRFDRILIVRLSAIGDVINTLPALAVLRQNLPRSYIAWVVEDKAKDLVLNHPDLNEVFVFSRQEWSPRITKPASLIKAPRQIPGFIKKIRRGHFDLAIDFQGNLKSGVVTYLSGAKVRAGFDKTAVREFSHFFTNLNVPLPKPRINRVERNLVLLKGLGINTNLPLQAKCPITQSDETYVNDFVNQRVRQEKPLVVFHPSTSRFGAFKRWAPANYTDLGDRLMDKYQVNLVITWGPGEQGLAEDIARKMKQQVITDFQTGSLTQLAVLLKKADLFVGSDSAPLHLASILGTPSVALFGPKDPLIYGPYPALCLAKSGTILIRKDLKCSPCTKRSCKKPDCMDLITVEEVFQAAEKILNEKREISR